MGIWDKDVLLGGERLNEEYEKGERFILFDMACISEDVPMPTGGTSEKSELVTAPMDKPTEFKVVGTLSTPIARKAKDNVRDKDGLPADADSFPIVAYWDTAPSGPDTPGDNDAVVLKPDMHVTVPPEAPVDKNARKSFAAMFAIRPITKEDNPL